jgi:hypothetical protein
MVNINAHGLCLSGQTNKEYTYTIQEALDYINNNEIAIYQALVLHVLTNDLKTAKADKVTKDMVNLVSVIQSKAADTKVIISLCPPRKDNDQ